MVIYFENTMISLKNANHKTQIDSSFIKISCAQSSVGITVWEIGTVIQHEVKKQTGSHFVPRKVSQSIFIYVNGVTSVYKYGPYLGWCLILCVKLTGGQDASICEQTFCGDVLHEINPSIATVGGADCSPPCGWALSNQVKVWIQ